MASCKCGGEAVRLGVDDVVHAALPVEGDVLRTMLRDGRKAHQLEKGAELGWLRMGKFDKLKTVGPHRIVVRYGCRRAIVGKRPHLQKASFAGPPLILMMIWVTGTGLKWRACARRLPLPDLHAKVIQRAPQAAKPARKSSRCRSFCDLCDT